MAAVVGMVGTQDVVAHMTTDLPTVGGALVGMVIAAQQASLVAIVSR